jgi:hypothetical protein
VPPGHSCLGFARGVVDSKSPKNKHNFVSLHVQLMWKIDTGGGRRPKVHRALFISFWAQRRTTASLILDIR